MNKFREALSSLTALCVITILLITGYIAILSLAAVVGVLVITTFIGIATVELYRDLSTE